MTTTKATAASTATALILGWMGFATMNDEPPAKPAAPPPPRTVAIRLLGPAGEITGIKVPKDLERQGDTYLRVEEPADVTVRLPGDRVVQMRVKYASVNVNHGVVVDVHLLPLPAAVPFREAVAELRRLMRTMDVEPDERMRKQMAGWPDDLPTHPPDFEPDLPYVTYCAGMELDELVGLGVNMRPAPDSRYYVALTFAASVDSRRPLWDPNFKPESKPPAVEKGKETPPDSSKK